MEFEEQPKYVDVAQLVRAGDFGIGADSFAGGLVSLKERAVLSISSNNRQMRVQIPTSAPFRLAAEINIAALLFLDKSFQIVISIFLNEYNDLKI